ncbi:homoserine O-acetyltransferase MetX [Brockia lithotrophica]|uniref:Homoserine O-acetyltransferase n=1 Tax=Brockia lithotrophica TaxID=933949 RepID=A0A660L3S5_9BACL|nr:homoserine O-acetyltransferase [Brockia lithotrophica]RKQ88556.1 homoserine O-acetyltransferase [Brockia lithotrophica]
MGESIRRVEGRVRLGPLTLESGEVLPEVELAYEDVGPAEAPVVLVCHALTGSHRTVGTSAAPGWWHPLVGVGKAVDPRRLRVITFNVLGGQDGSTGPRSIDPRNGRPYRARFPFVTIRDMVRAQRLGLIELGVNHVVAVIGGSMGGMQVLEWGLMYPDFMDLLVPLAVTPATSAFAIAFNAVGRLAITSDPAWREGEYPEDDPPAVGLSLARMIGVLTYRTPEQFARRFGRSLKHGWGHDHREVAFQVESYLLYQGEKLVERFDANSYLYLLKAVDSHDIGRGRGGWREAARGYRARIVAVGFRGDLLYPPEEIRSFVEHLRALGKDAIYAEVASEYGHDAFLVEGEQVGEILRRHAPELFPDPAPASADPEGAALLAASRSASEKTVPSPISG